MLFTLQMPCEGKRNLLPKLLSLSVGSAMVASSTQANIHRAACRVSFHELKLSCPILISQLFCSALLLDSHYLCSYAYSRDLQTPDWARSEVVPVTSLVPDPPRLHQAWLQAEGSTYKRYTPSTEPFCNSWELLTYFKAEVGESMTIIKRVIREILIFF